MDVLDPSFRHEYNINEFMNEVLYLRYGGVDSASNMAVVAVAMVSGWIPDKSSIEKVCVIIYVLVKFGS